MKNKVTPKVLNAEIYETEPEVWSNWADHYNAKGWRTALLELINNAIDACRKSSLKKVYVKFNGKTLVVKNTGICFVDRQHVRLAWCYGKKGAFQAGLNNMGGTGLKSSCAYSCSDPEKFTMYVKTQDGEFLRIKGFVKNGKFDIKIEALDIWEYGEYNTVITTPVDAGKYPDVEKVREYISEEITNSCKLYNIKFYFNGKTVKGFEPGELFKKCGIINLVYIDPKSGFQYLLRGFNYYVTNPLWATETRHGFYISTGGSCLVYVSTSVLSATLNSGRHDDYNHIITYLDIEPIGDAPMPAMTNDKTEFRWDERTPGLLVFIRKNCDAPYKAERDRIKKTYEATSTLLKPGLAARGITAGVTYNIQLFEKIKESKVDGVVIDCDSEGHAVSVEELTKDGNSYFTDAFCRANKIKYIILLDSHKKPINYTSVIKAIGTISMFEKIYQYKPELLIAGRDLRDDAETALLQMGLDVKDVFIKIGENI